MTNLKQKLVCGAAALIASATFVGTSATQAETPRERSVSYADLDMSRDAGKATFAARVRAAAEQVCRAGGQSLAEQNDEKRCIQNAVDTAMSKAVTL